MPDVDGLEAVGVTSVGIDIGTSTTHVIFSRLVARRRGADLSAEFEIATRTPIHLSPVVFTPYRDPENIDTEALAEFVEAAYRAAGLAPSDVDTGVVVVTGEALNRENAQAIAERFAAGSGRFVCVSAGANHEAVLAAHGAGAVEASRHDGATVVNVDIGGGTTKVAVARDGAVVATAAVAVGARLVAFDTGGRVTRLEDAGRVLGRLAGVEVRTGGVLTTGDRDRLATVMAAVVLDVADGHRPDETHGPLMLTDPLPAGHGVSAADAVMLSGGVAEYVFDPAQPDRGDLGTLLAARLREAIAGRGLADRVRMPGSAVRATVLGAGEYSLTPSGVTSHVADPAPLPVYGLQVVKAVVDGDAPGAAVRSALRRCDREAFGPGLVLALSFRQPPDYAVLRAAARAVADVRGPETPLYVVMDVDRAGAFGHLLTVELGYPDPVVVLDGVRVGDLDHLDIGTPLAGSDTVPVTVKSMVFPTSNRRPEPLGAVV